MKKSVIIAPLNWGLGHATRCIPIVRDYIRKDWLVKIASDGESLLLLKEEFPSLEFLEIPSYNIKYAPGNLMAFAILRQLPKLKKAIQDEHNWLNEYVKNNKVDLIISDNRYGFYTESTKSIFMTHQLFIQVPIAQKAINKVNHSYINKFDECWVPDTDDEWNLSGKLSHGNTPFPVKYIGPISRFKKRELPLKYRVVAVLSGPEPSRGKFEKELVKVLSNIDNVILIRGIQDSNQRKYIGKLEVVDHIPQDELETLFNQARLIIARTGYSSIMDIAKLKKASVLVPTPGQSEQEYLAKYLKNHPLLHFIKEENISKYLKDRIEEFDFKLD